MDARLKEHQRHIRLGHPDKSATEEHSVDLGHHIQFHNTSILASKTQYMDRIIREAIEIELHPDNINREMRFCLSRSWKPLICPFKKPDTRPIRLRRSMHGPQSGSEAIGSMPLRNDILFPTPTGS
jgi:hypothetical protein